MKIEFNINIDDRIVEFFKRIIHYKYLPAIAAGLVLIPLAVYAAPVVIPNTFTANTAISSSAVNANFTALKTAVDDNDARISSIQYYSANASNILTLTGSFSDLSSLNITPPRNGFLLVTGKVSVDWSNVNSCDSLVYADVYLGIATTSGGTPSALSLTRNYFNASDTNSGCGAVESRQLATAVTDIISVTQGVPVNIYLVGKGVNSPEAVQRGLIAIFFPN
jgi:hypothetical protein